MREGNTPLDRFCADWYRRLTGEAGTGPVIYHYTGPGGLLGILGGMTLRATNIAFLNDSAEYYLSLERIRAALDRHAHGREDLAPFREGMGHRLRVAEERVPDVYVVSFSRAADLLSQWRGYGDVESGYAVGFDVDALRDSLTADGSILAPCVYAGEQQDAFADDLVRTVADLWCRATQRGQPSQRGEALLDEAFGRLAWFAALFKHPGFAEEQEWRLIRLVKPDDTHALEFFARETCIATYLPVRFDPAVVREVWVGPSRHQHLSVPALTVLLRNRGYDAKVAVQRSAVPYRLV